MRKLHLRTKVLLSVLAGLILIAGGLLIFKPSLFKGSASTMLPGPTGSTMLPGPITLGGSSIKGRVNGSNNTSLSTVTVEAFKGSETVAYSRTGTDVNGNYSMINLPANTQFTLKFTAFQGYRTVKQTVTTKSLLFGLIATVTANQSMQPYGYGKLSGRVTIGGKSASPNTELHIYPTKWPDYLGYGDRIGCSMMKLVAEPSSPISAGEATARMDGLPYIPPVSYTCPFAEGTYTAITTATGATNSPTIGFTITSGKTTIKDIAF